MMVIDITDFEGTIPWKYIEKLKKGGHEVFVTVNKVDCVPATVSKEKLKGWVMKRLRTLVPDLQIVPWI